jgi:hypothetical protein
VNRKHILMQGGDSENLENKQKVSGRWWKENLICTRNSRPIHCRMKTWRLKIKLNSIKYWTTRITEHSGEYSMMYSLDKSRFPRPSIRWTAQSSYEYS